MTMMAKLILKSPYIKPNSVTNCGGYIKYIATRKGVENPNDSKIYLPATDKQKHVIASLVKKYPDAKELYEYEDYINSPIRKNADELIGRIAEMHLELLDKRDKYIEYIATRPRVEKIAEHGLFTDDGVPVILDQIAREISNYQGNIWTHIISLRREDAARLGYDSVQAWQNLLRSKRNMIAENMNIHPNRFRWYAAFHNESHHPHVHLVAYSIDSKEAYLSRKGIEKIKSSLVSDIFYQDRISIFEKQTEYRDQLKKDWKVLLDDIVAKIKADAYENRELEQNLIQLSERLSRTKGKKVYGYLKTDVKQIVNAIADMLAENPNIASLYDLWYEQKFEYLKIYSSNLPPKVPLSENKVFKSIKNIIIREALNLCENKDQMTSPHQIVVPAVARLLNSLCHIFQDNLSKQSNNNSSTIDKRQRKEIEEKKNAEISYT